MPKPAATRYVWKEIGEDRPMPMLARRRIIGARAMISEIRLEKGCAVPSHAHENEQFAVVTSGRLRFSVGAEDTPDHQDVVVVGGEVLHLPSNVPHSVVALEDSRVLDIFSPPSEKTGIDRT